MDGATILSITQSPPHGESGLGGGGTAGGGPTSVNDLPIDTGTQRKITLLTRRTPPVGSGGTTSSNSNVSSIIVGGEGGSSLMNSDLPQSGGPGVLPAGALPTPGRAARNDYYDTEDPSVNLHDFLVNSLQAQKNRVVLLKLEEEFLTYVTDPKRVEPLKLPPWDSYHRMLAHRVAAYFGLEHNVDPIDKSCVVVCKGPQTRVPVHRFSDFLSMDTDAEGAEPKLILKRSGREAVSLEKSFEALSNLPSDVKSFEQREEEYEKARARIFSQQPLQGSHSSIAFDLGSAPQRTRSSLLPAIMQHRRTVSDTLLFRRPSAFDELKKDGPSSSHSSRSATPLVALFRQPQEGGVVSQPPAQAQPQSVQGVVTPQQSPQQQKLQSREIASSQGQALPLQSHQPRPQTKYMSQRPTNVPSFQFQPLQRSMPVFYPQPAAIVTDPNWYNYNMMLYQVSPQQFIPAAPYGQVIQPTMYPVSQQYPISPGMMAAQSPMVSPPVSTRPGPHMRLPIMSPPGGVVDSLPSPSHTSGVTLVRPIAQTATPTRAPFKFANAPTSTIVQPQGYPMQPQAPAVLASQQRMVATAQPGASPLSEQMEQLSLGPGGGRSVGGGVGVGEGEVVRAAPHGEGGAVAMSKGAHKLGQGPHHGDGGRNGKSAILNGSFLSGYAVMPTPGMEAVTGQMMSPTQVPSTMQFLPAHMQPHVMPASPDPQLVSPQHIPPGTPGGVMHYPGSLPNQSPSAPTTPPIGHLGFPSMPSMLSAQQPQNVFSPPSTGVTHSPVQILGHTLGTSLFSPPPSSTAHHGMFINSPSSAGKVLGYPSGSPAHAPVGSGLRFRRYESPKQGGHVSEVPVAPPPQPQPGGGLSQVQFMHENPMPQHKQQPKANGSNGGAALSGSSGFQPVQLPPRLASQQQQQQQNQQQQQRNSGTRYQNQRHPANRAAQVNKVANPGIVAEPGQFLQLSGKKEPLLPTPPTAQMVKLDTTLTCGVPLHVMEIVTLPQDGTPERQQAFQLLRDLGAQDIKGGRINKTGEEVLIATFPSPDMAIKVLQMQNMPFTLSLPRNNHAKFILSLLQNVAVQ